LKNKFTTAGVTCSGEKQYFTLIACDLLSLKKGCCIDSLINALGVHIMGPIKVNIILVILKFLLKENYYYV